VYIEQIGCLEIHTTNVTLWVTLFHREEITEWSDLTHEHLGMACLVMFPEQFPMFPVYITVLTESTCEALVAVGEHVQVADRSLVEYKHTMRTAEVHLGLVSFGTVLDMLLHLTPRHHHHSAVNTLVSAAVVEIHVPGETILSLKH
jgi:hypothetical protein